MEFLKKLLKKLMPSPYTKLSKKEFKQAYANRRTSSKTLKKRN